jgi:hypothetical protein
MNKFYKYFEPLAYLTSSVLCIWQSDAILAAMFGFCCGASFTEIPNREKPNIANNP